MNYSIQQYTVMSAIGQDGFVPTLEKLGKLGFSGIEMCSFKGFADAGYSAKELKNILGGCGLSLVGNHFSKRFFDGPYNEQYEFVSEAGGRYITYSRYLDYDEETIKITAQFLNETSRIAAKHGLTVTYHNHDREFDMLNGTTAYERLVGLLDPTVKLETDVFFIKEMGLDVDGFIEKHSDRVAQLHLKQINANGKNTDLPDGIIDICSAISSAKHATDFILEQAEFDKPVLDSVARSAEYLAKLR